MLRTQQAEEMILTLIDDISVLSRKDIENKLYDILKKVKDIHNKAIYENKNGQAVIYDGVEYPSVSALSRELNTHNTTIYKWIYNGTTRDGIEVRFKDPNRTLMNVDRYKRKKPSIQLDGVVYKSMTEAMKETGYSKSYIEKRCIKLYGRGINYENTIRN